jgi:predicted HicB family RNase H-like nuclease
MIGTEYLGYRIARLNVDENAGLFFGEARSINGSVTFMAPSLGGVRAAFRDAVDRRVAKETERTAAPG